MPFLLAIDQGTTSTRALVYDESGRCRGLAQKEFTQHFPQPGWVEHDADEIWQSVAEVVPLALEQAKIQGKDLLGIGLTNQRETSLIWERASSKPVARAIVWQDRRTSQFCRQHASEEPWIFERTGLVVDPYFSATKLRWLLEADASLRSRADSGALACGTIDTWLVWKLTAGKVHATDVTNASRTLLLDIRNAAWDEELLQFFGVPRGLLPEVCPSSHAFGVTADLGFLPPGIPIAGIAGDQQAALFGQGGFTAGSAKCTYGTGAFYLQHTGDTLIHSEHRLLSSLAAATSNRHEYVLEGSIFIAGAAVQWLRDGLQLIDDSPQVEGLAGKADRAQQVIFVPALVGLGAPHWVPEAEGVLFGVTRGTTRAELARAVLDGVAYQVADLVDAAKKDSGLSLKGLKADGGMARNGLFLQAQADLLGIPVIPAMDSEATALGAAFLAGLQTGLWPDVAALEKLLPPGKEVKPGIGAEERNRRRELWKRALDAVIQFYRP